ncbi:MAG: hypothetical protein ACOZE5_12025 [Verrucomicrobiota bacterium]
MRRLPANADSKLGGALVILVTALIWLGCLRFPVVWQATGIGETSVPFLDLYGSLAAGEIAAQGGDPYRPNPLDPFHRPHLYSGWWLVTGTLGLTRADASWLGLTLILAGLICAVVIIRPVTSVAAAQAVLVLCSPAILMAVNRGNNDWVVFILLCFALVGLRSPTRISQAAGAALIAVATALKYYPGAAFLALLSARTRRESLGLLGICLLVGMLSVPALLPGLQSVTRFAPQPDGLYAFGAPVLFRNFALPVIAGWLVPVVVILLAALGLAIPECRQAGGPTLEPEADREFVFSAAVLTGCFFLGASYAYKLIFSLWMLPALTQGHSSTLVGRWRRPLWWILLASLWSEGLLALVINVVLTPLSRDAALGTLSAALIIGPLLTWVLIVMLASRLLVYSWFHLRRLGLVAQRA